MSIFSRIKDFFTPKVIFVGQSELSHRVRSKPKSFRYSSYNSITKKVLEDNEDARDDKELFISLVQCYNEYSFCELEGFSRSWRYIQCHFPELRGKEWEIRQRKAHDIAKLY